MKDDFKINYGVCRRCKTEWNESEKNPRLLQYKAVPVWVAEHKLFDLLLPVYFKESYIKDVVSFLKRFRTVMSQQTRLDFLLADFLNTQPFVCFNYLLMPNASDSPRETDDPMEWMHIGHEKVPLSDQEQDDLFWAIMKQYV